MIDVDDFEEKRYCVMYWRGDEGRGESVCDMAGNEVTGKIG